MSATTFLAKVSHLFFLLVSAVAANTGQVTFYTPGMGACGIRSSSNDLIVAVAAEFYDTFPGATANPSLNPACKKMLTVHYKDKSVSVMVTDKCPGCKGKFDLDLSPAAFSWHLADQSVGRLFGAQWTMDRVTKNTTAEDPTPEEQARGSAQAVEHRMVRRPGRAMEG